jgi:hypothetical protein
MAPPPATPSRPDHDHRPSMRVRVASSVLRHGHDTTRSPTTPAFPWPWWNLTLGADIDVRLCVDDRVPAGEVE